MEQPALTAKKVQVIYRDLGWTEGHFADIIGVPRKKNKTHSSPVRKNAGFFLCPCKAQPDHPGAELKE